MRQTIIGLLLAVTGSACSGATPVQPSAVETAPPRIVQLRVKVLSHDVANAVIVNGTPYYQDFPDEAVELVGARYVPGEAAIKRTDAKGVVEWRAYFGVEYRLRTRGRDFGANVLGGDASWLLFVEAGIPY